MCVIFFSLLLSSFLLPFGQCVFSLIFARSTARDKFARCSRQSKVAGAEEHRLLEFRFHDLIRTVLRQLDVVEARVHAGQRQVGYFAVGTVDRDVVLQAGEPTPWQSLGAS